MKLKTVQVQFFRNTLDSTPVDVQDDVTCLVGKNESGKTAFLEALQRLNPAQGNPEISIGKQYPAWLEKKHRRQGQDLEKVNFVTCEFSLEDDDKTSLERRYGAGAVPSTDLTVIRNYSGKSTYTFDTNEAKAVSHLVANLDLPKGVEPTATTFEELSTFAGELQTDDKADEERKAAGTQISEAIQELLAEELNFRKAVLRSLIKLMPRFFYFAEYSRLPGIIKIKELLESEEEDLDVDELTALSLLTMAGAEDDYLLNPDYETRKRELENVANAITQDVLEYWTTNKDLRALIDVTTKTVPAPNGGQQSVLDELHVRMYDDQHMLSLPFGERSSGFQWFFSFLAAFSRYEDSDEPVIILLDEPGLGLHARAQKDFLRFIDERLSKRQVIYTTHSPFMVQPDKLERARVVEDQGRETGSRVSSDVLTTDPDTLFPLQGALGYDIAQHLLITQNNLVVEGPSDLLYLMIFSDFLVEKGREGLDDRLSVVPVGGADMIPTFVALLGIHLEMSILVDARKKGHQRLTSLADQGFLKATRIVTVGEITGTSAADIEDLFSPGDYLKLYNKAFGKSLKVSDLQGNDPIVNRIARAEGVERFNHNKPADTLLRNRDLLSGMSGSTVDNFEKLISKLNASIPENGES